MKRRTGKIVAILRFSHSSNTLQGDSYGTWSRSVQVSEEDSWSGERLSEEGVSPFSNLYESAPCDQEASWVRFWRR